jgi:molybdopterin-containing oxidoreductase family membrane subunit
MHQESAPPVTHPLESGDGVPPVMGPGYTFRSVSEKISSITLTGRTPRGWWLGFAVAFAFTMLLLYTIFWLLFRGVGIWGINVPVAWGFAIINFVWWIGIGHAGTLISAILLLLHQKWRTSINRFAEAMTLFAVANAGLFPLFHMGRPWFFYWLLPYPNTMRVWPQFRSPLVWDVFAVSTYGTVSLLFWYVGLIPDLATLRDRARNRWVQVIYGIMAMGWRGSAYHWKRYEITYLILAALATPLVLSVHTVVSFDFAVAILPGWHSTVFPPYFVAGAIYSGFAMVLVLAIPLRAFYGLQDFITMRHLQNSAKVMLATGLIVGYGYGIEAFMGWYSGSIYEKFAQVNRMFGPYAVYYWLLITCNVVIPQVLWLKGVRNNPPWLFLVSLIILVGMWLERYVIVITSLHRDYLPSSWGNYSPTVWDWTMYLGTIGFFLALMFLFVRLLPMISIAEMQTLLAESQETGEVATKEKV